MADAEAFARAGGRGSASSAGGPRDRLAPAAASSCLLRRARIAAASAPPVAAGRGLAPGDIATESGTSESGTSSASAAAAAAAATASTGAASPPAEDSVSVGALLCGNVDGMYEHITSAGVHPGNVGGTSVSARSARPPGSEGPEGRSEGRDDCFVAASNEDVFGDSEGAAAVSGTPSRLSALSAGAESGKGDVAATATFVLAPSAHARPPGGVLNPAEAAAAVHSDPGVSAAGESADSRLGSVAAGLEARRRNDGGGPTGDREGAGEGRWRDGAGEAVVGTSPASPTPTSSSSGAICVPPTSSSSAFSSSSEASSVGTVSICVPPIAQSPASSSSSSSSRSDTAGPSSSAVGSATSASASARGSSPGRVARLIAGWLAPSPGARHSFSGSVAVAAVLFPALSHPPSEYPSAASADADPGHEDGASVASDLETPVAVFRESPKTSRAAIAPTSRPRRRRAPKPNTAAVVAAPVSPSDAGVAVPRPTPPASASRSAAVSVAVTIAETAATSSPRIAPSAAASTSARRVPRSAAEFFAAGAPGGAPPSAGSVSTRRRDALGGADDAPGSSAAASAAASTTSVRKSARRCCVERGGRGNVASAATRFVRTTGGFQNRNRKPRQVRAGRGRGRGRGRTRVVVRDGVVHAGLRLRRYGGVRHGGSRGGHRVAVARRGRLEGTSTDVTDEIGKAGTLPRRPPEPADVPELVLREGRSAPRVEVNTRNVSPPKIASRARPVVAPAASVFPRARGS